MTLIASSSIWYFNLFICFMNKLYKENVVKRSKREKIVFMEASLENYKQFSDGKRPPINSETDTTPFKISFFSQTLMRNFRQNFGKLRGFLSSTRLKQKCSGSFLNNKSSFSIEEGLKSETESDKDARRLNFFTNICRSCQIFRGLRRIKNENVQEEKQFLSGRLLRTHEGICLIEKNPRWDVE